MAISAEQFVSKLPDKEVVDIFELSKWSGISERTLREHQEQIPGRFYIGRLLRFHLPTVRKAIAEGGLLRGNQS